MYEVTIGDLDFEELSNVQALQQKNQSRAKQVMQWVDKLAQMYTGIRQTQWYRAQWTGNDAEADRLQTEITFVDGLRMALTRLSRCWSMPGQVSFIPTYLLQKRQQNLRTQRLAQMKASTPPSESVEFEADQRYFESLVDEALVASRYSEVDFSAVLAKLSTWYIGVLNGWTASLNAAKDRLAAKLQSATSPRSLKKAYDYVARCATCADATLQTIMQLKAPEVPAPMSLYPQRFKLETARRTRRSRRRYVR